MTPQTPKTWKLERFENGQAVLSGADGTIKILRSQLVDGVKEGEILTAEFYPLKDQKKRQDNLAHALLEEILTTE